MVFLKNILGGLAGAIALNLLHEGMKNVDHKAPRVDLVGEEALNKVISATGAKPLHGNKLYAATLVGDILSNAVYYSFIGNGKSKYIWFRGIAYGLAAGVGALTLTEPLGLRDAPVTKTNETRVLTVGYYLLGGLVAAMAIKTLRFKE